MTSVFKEMFRSDELPGDPAVDNAHRVGPDKNTRRTMIVRMQRLQVKQAIINYSKQKGSINFRGMRVWIYPDLTSEENRKRALFNDVRKKLREAKVHHGIRHPATLLITFKGETKSFSSSTDAEAHFNKNIKPTLPSESGVNGL